MRIRRIDHVGVIVDDLPAAKAFFLNFGFEVQGEGEWLDQIVGLNGVKTTFVMLGLSDGEANLELIKFYSPSDDKGIQQTSATWVSGILHLRLSILKRLLTN